MQTPGSAAPIPDPAVLVLIGAAGSGKSSWAAAHYRAAEIVSADALRAVVGSGEADLDASADAFGLLDTIIAARVRRRLTVVVDTLGLEPVRRLKVLAAARAVGLRAVAVLFVTPPPVCRERNRRRDRPVPARALADQLRAFSAVRGAVAVEGWDAVLEVGSGAPAAAERPVTATTGDRVAAPATPEQAPALAFTLQVSRFPWGTDPVAWLTQVASAAVGAGFTGLAVMDHLIQIPQVGRDFEPIPDPWVTLGLIAGQSTNLRLGTLVSPISLRAPGLLAKAVATLDVLSGGRAFCGIGAGWWAREHAAYGLPFQPAPARLDAVEAAIEGLRAWWQPGTKAYTGQRVSLPETTCYPRPLSEVPIIVGGAGPRTLRIAGRLADGANVPSDPGLLGERIATLRAARESAGRDWPTFLLTVLDVPVVGEDREHTARLVEKLRGRTAAAQFARRHHAGTAAEQVERYADLMQRGVGMVFVALPDLSGPVEIERFAPITAAFR